MVWCVFWFAPAIFSLTGLVILVRHGLCAARLLAEPPLTARWIVPERVRATRRFPIAWTTVSRFCLTHHSFSPCANLKACAGFRLINNQSHSGEWSRDVGDSDRQDRGRLRLAHLPAVAPTPEAPPSPQGLLVVDAPRGLRLGLDRRRPRPLLVGSGRPYPSSALPDDAHRRLALPSFLNRPQMVFHQIER